MCCIPDAIMRGSRVSARTGPTRHEEDQLFPPRQLFRPRLCQCLGRYQGFEDPHFRQDAQAHVVERCWEMYLAVAFLDNVRQNNPAVAWSAAFTHGSG